jgi:hypothetical protein
MPTDPQSLLIYAIVVLALSWLGWRGWRRYARRTGCGSDCGCEDGVRRDPVIQRFLERRDRKRKKHK